MHGNMTIAEGQRDVRTVFLNGSVGQAVSGAIWIASAAAGTWAGVRPAVLILVFGGMFIFPLTQLVLRLAGRPTGLRRGHPLNALAMQVAFVVPLTLPVAGGAALHRIDWFYPAVMVLVGAHYMPFIFLYGMRSFGVLAAALMAGGVGLGLWGGAPFTAGGWLTGAVLLAFAAWGAAMHRSEHGVAEAVPGPASSPLRAHPSAP